MLKPTIAIALIVKNEEKKLTTCLESVKDWVDEIIVLDSGSTDLTESIARKYTDKFYIHKEWKGFGKQRQIAQKYIESDFVFWLDADEVVTKELKDDILFKINNHNEKTIYKVNRLTTAFGKEIHFSGWSPDWVVRLYKTNSTTYNDALVHESVKIPNGHKVEKLKGRLKHYTFEQLSEYTRKTNLYIHSWADQRQKKKNKIMFATPFLHGFFRFFKMYIVKLGFMDGKHGLLLSLLSANTVFTRYADLWIRGYVEERNKKHQ